MHHSLPTDGLTLEKHARGAQGGQVRVPGRLAGPQRERRTRWLRDLNGLSSAQQHPDKSDQNHQATAASNVGALPGLIRLRLDLPLARLRVADDRVGAGGQLPYAVRLPIQNHDGLSD
jgi:hypothetical protein